MAFTTKVSSIVLIVLSKVEKTKTFEIHFASIFNSLLIKRWKNDFFFLFFFFFFFFFFSQGSTLNENWIFHYKLSHELESKS